MSVIILLIIFSVLVAGGFLAAFVWAVRSGQYDDTRSPAVRMLQEDQPSEKSKSKRSSGKTGEKPGPGTDQDKARNIY